MEKSEEVKILCLQNALNDTQGTIRAFDAKANSLGVLLTVAIGITNFTLFQTQGPWTKCFLAASWIAGLAAIFFLGAVLHPLRNPHQSLVGRGEGTYYFLTSELTKNVYEMIDRIDKTNWIHELTYENMKVSMIRDYKNAHFKRAVKLSGVCLLSIALAVLFALGGI